MSALGTTAPPAAAATAQATPVAGRLYRVIWRWHFYAGLFVVPFMVMLAITGSIYLFKPQLDRLMYPLTVQPAGSTLPAARQLESVLAAYPGSQVSAFRPPDALERSSEFAVTTADGRELTVFVNPYTASVLGERDEQNNLQYYAVTLHGELMIGTIGDRIIELAASWGLVLIVSGLYLWWPRKGSRIWGTLLPRLNRANRRVFWRDLHAVPGFWGALLLIFMLLTGLPWAGFWGDSFAKISSRFPAPMWDAVPESTVLTGSLNDTANKTVPWAVEQLPMPQSDGGDHAAHGNGAASGQANTLPQGAVTLDTVASIAQQRGVAPGYTVSIPSEPTGVYTVSIFPDDPAKEATLHIDQYSGEVLADVRFAQYGLVPKAVELGIAVHEGKYFGLANQLLMFGACLLIILLAVSGVVMWWQRRPAGRLGAPAMPSNLPLWKGAVAVIAVMGVLFPLVGISLLIVLAVDWLLVRRIPALRTAIG